MAGIEESNIDTAKYSVVVYKPPNKCGRASSPIRTVNDKILLEYKIVLVISVKYYKLRSTISLNQRRK